MLKYLKTTVCAVAGLALGATAALANPYEEFAGETLVVNFPAHPHFDAVMKVLPEFTKETGIRVEVDQLQYL
ncbi:MAG: sugar ABC transporter substrate-binding protein, partial [Pseudomonadota bacterium]